MATRGEFGCRERTERELVLSWSQAAAIAASQMEERPEGGWQVTVAV